jgi:chorismate mutase/prephenate dehydratase
VATLEELRGEIDQIDVQLHDLLIRRVEIGREVATAKAGAPAGGPNLRPGREAQIMRRLAERNREPLAIASVARIWREILSANLNQQITVNAAVFAPDTRVHDLAREYCGTASAITAMDSAEAAVDTVASGAAQFAILPGIEAGQTWRWWPLLLGPTTDKPRILARLPYFTAGSNAVDAFIIGPQEPEPSGDDVTLFALKGDAAIDGGREIDRADMGEGWRLVEVNGYIDDLHGYDHPREDRYRLGAYATQSPL